MKNIYGKQRLYAWLMRGLVLHLFFFFSIFSVAGVFPSAGQGILKSKISLYAEGMKIKSILKKIEEEGTVRFAYQPMQIDVDRTVSLSIEDSPLENVLAMLFDSNVMFEERGNLVMIRPAIVINTNDIIISGKVVDETGAPLPGVNVVVKGTLNGTSTDIDGKYSLLVEAGNKILLFTFVGYLPQEVAIGSRNIIDINLVADQRQLDEVVVVGYGTQKKVSLTSAVSRVEGDELTRRPISNVQQALQGLAPGVTVMDIGGAPGRSEANVRVRGVTSFNINASGSTATSLGSSTSGYAGFDLSKNSALVLVDGIEQRLSDFNPEDIESISILKDAASTAIYGSRATNGVVLVTTKRAKANKVTVNYSMYYAMQQSINQPQMMDIEPFLRLQQVAFANSGITTGLPVQIQSEQSIQTWVNAVDREKYPLPNTWFKTVLRTAPQINHTFSLAGGSDVIRARLSARYMDQKGIAANYNNMLREVKLNTDFKASKKISFSADINYRSNLSTSPVVEPWQNMLHGSLWAVPKYGDGTYGLGPGRVNPLMFAEISGVNKLNNEQTMATLKGEWEIINGLKFLSQFAARFNNQNSKNFANAYTTTDKYTNNTYTAALSTLTEIRNTLRETTWNNLLTYEKLFNKHELKVLGGFSEIQNTQTFLTAYRQGFYNNDITSIGQGSNDATKNNTGYDAAFVLRSFFGRVNYSFDNKYLFEVNGRYDGSSKFTGTKQYGFFPAVSAGWRVSQENFWKGLSHIVSDLKLRASWGKQGNQSVDLYSYYSSLNLVNYTFGGVSVLGYRQSTLANTDLGWETTTQTDFGADVSFLDGRLTLTVDYYNKLTQDILLNLGIPTTLGLDAPPQNAGSVENKGLELGIGFRGNTGPNRFRYSINPNFSINNNKVVDLKGTGPYITSVNNSPSYPIYIIAAGLPINTLWGYKTDGLFQTQAEVDNYPTIATKSKPGDVKYLDLNNDKKIDANDYMDIGHTFPKYTFGLQTEIGYKNFDLNMVIQGVADIDTRLGGALSDHGNFEGYAHKILTNNYWTPENPGAEFPRPRKRDARNGYTADRNIIDGSYLRFKNIQLGYTLPAHIIKKINATSLRLYVSGTNLITFSKLNRWNLDPEVEPGVAVYYPQTSVYTMGLNFQY